MLQSNLLVHYIASLFAAKRALVDFNMLDKSFFYVNINYPRKALLKMSEAMKMMPEEMEKRLKMVESMWICRGLSHL